MGTVYKILGQSNPTASSLTMAYTVPALTQTIISSIVVTNTSPTSTPLFRISLAVAGAGDALSQYVYYDLPILPNDTFAITGGITLGAGDVVRVKSTTNDLVFSIFGSEIS